MIADAIELTKSGQVMRITVSRSVAAGKTSGSSTLRSSPGQLTAAKCRLSVLLGMR